MAAKLIGFACCLLCSAAFFGVRVLFPDDREPISFFTSDPQLKNRIKNIPLWNEKMLQAYRLYGLAWLMAAGLLLWNTGAGYIMIACNLTLGLAFVYLRYRSLLKTC